jgi:ABC-2 type transport system permease protein
MAGGGLAMGQVLVKVLTSEDLAGILDAAVVENEAAARAAVEAGQTYSAVIIIPADFSRAIRQGVETEVIVYSDPARQLSGQIVESVVRQITGQLSTGAGFFSVTLNQLFAGGRLNSEAGAQAVIQALLTQLQQNPAAIESLITLETIDASGRDLEFDPLAFFAPSMAIIFLAFGASQGTRSILAEEEMGTFVRLNATPTPANQILLGKLLGTFFSSAIQFGVLLIASALLFKLAWGDPLAVLSLSALVILAFTSLGLVMAVIARDQAQAATISNTVLLVFMVIGGNFSSAENFPAWLQTIAKITPNYWGMQGFIKMGQGLGLTGLGPELLALTVMSLLWFGLGSLLYRRRAAG